MNRRHVPPPPSELDALFRRERRALADVRMDADFPARVEAAVRARRGRTLPGWAAVAAAVLLALGAGLLKGDRGAMHADALPGGPRPGGGVGVPGPGPGVPPGSGRTPPVEAVAPAPHGAGQPAR